MVTLYVRPNVRVDRFSANHAETKRGLLQLLTRERVLGLSMTRLNYLRVVATTKPNNDVNSEQNTIRRTKRSSLGLPRLTRFLRYLAQNLRDVVSTVLIRLGITNPETYVGPHMQSKPLIASHVGIGNVRIK